ncbi:putative capsid protein [Odonata associated gemycircularvirus 2]|uniref:Putative capsid protein n=1 Tax=Odonata associated gemycircularvirus 2 TaxID=1985391 RepID=A0A0B4UGH9_9VIRU|nr:putative capsid protein [Odonata associated gemycircularvirus 2]
MVYRSKSRRRTTRRSSTRKRPSTRRRSYGKKRSTFRSRRMSSKRILNLTSKKKQDNMLSFSNTASDGTPTTVAQGSLYVAGVQSGATSNYGMSIFCPTARSLVTAGPPISRWMSQTEPPPHVTLRGYKENLRIQTSSSQPWLWRRIVFNTKGPTFSSTSVGDTATRQKYSPFSDTSIGMARLWFNTSVNAMSATQSLFQTVMFKGAINQDWSDPITAKVDTSRITVMSDRTQTIKTQNSNGHFSERKLWYPMNKNLVYDDDEAGAAEVPAYYSTDAKPGMGDVYIVDFVMPSVGATASDIINFNCTSTLYWHEK